MSSKYGTDFPALGSTSTPFSSTVRSRTGTQPPPQQQHESSTSNGTWAAGPSSQHLGTAAAGQIGDADAEDVVFSEDVGPRTLHRRAKPKPGIPFKVLKARNADTASSDEDDGGDPDAPITLLPPEVLARIFAYLDPQSIAQSASVCKAFARVVGDDRTWRLAFSVAFHIEAQGTNALTQTTPVLRRVDRSSWRAEYVRRTSLLRTWRRTRSPVVTCDPRISTIHTMALSLSHNFLLCGSENYGVATRCQPFTGKVSKGFIDSSGLVNGVGAGALAMAAEHAGLEVSCVRMDADAGRIVWGFHNGIVGVTTLGKQGTDPRGLVRGNRFPPRGSHIGAVIDIALPFGNLRTGAHSFEKSADKTGQRRAQLGEAAETFVTAGIDGSIRLWSPQRPTPLWSAVVHQGQESSSGRQSPVVCVAYNIECGTIAAANLAGQVVAWCGINVKSLLEVQPIAFDVEMQTLAGAPAAVTEARIALKDITDRIARHDLAPSSDTAGAAAASSLHLDFGNGLQQRAEGTSRDGNLACVSLLVLQNNASDFTRYDVPLASVLPISVSAISQTKYAGPKGTEFTCLRPDFEIYRTDVPAQAFTSYTRARTAPLFSERKFVCAGTRDGHLAIWDWAQGANVERAIEPSLYLEIYPSPVTAIELTEHAIILGFADGTIKAICPLTGQHLRTLNDRAATRHPARMLAAGELTAEEAARFTVTQIIASSDVLVASVGSHILSWRPEPLRTKASARKATTRTGRASVGRLWDPKMQSKKEVERDVLETRQELEKEYKERQDARFRIGSRADADVDGMTEEEMFEYAMMLSRDEAQVEEERRLRASASINEESNELENALAQFEMDESITNPRQSHRPNTSEAEETDAEAETSGSVSRRSPSCLASPSLVASPPSRAWDILQNAGPSAARNTHFDTFSKVQAMHVPHSARLSHGSSRRPSMSPGLHAQSSHSNLPALNSPTEWPSFELSSSAAGRSPSRLDLDSSVLPSSSRQSPFGRATQARASTLADTSPNFGSPTPGSVPKPTAIGAWAAGSPSLRPVQSQRGNDHQGSISMPKTSSDEDADLRFAIELSLAEEQSRAD